MRIARSSRESPLSSGTPPARPPPATGSRRTTAPGDANAVVRKASLADRPGGTGQCDRHLAALFGDDGAIAAASGYEPSGFPPSHAVLNGLDRSTGGMMPNQWGHLFGYAMHLYAAPLGLGRSTVYVPPGFTKKTPPNGNDAVSLFYYPELGNQKAVTLAVYHLGDYAVRPKEKNAAGSVRVGVSGGLGGDGVGYLHSHLEVHRGWGLPSLAKRNETRVFFPDVFCGATPATGVPGGWSCDADYYDERSRLDASEVWCDCDCGVVDPRLRGRRAHRWLRCGRELQRRRRLRRRVNEPGTGRAGRPRAATPRDPPGQRCHRAPVRRWLGRSIPLASFALVALACGGRVVVDGAGAGAAPGAAECADHGDCPGRRCVFSSGRCADPCPQPSGPSGTGICGAGVVCDACATSSCPGCRDCEAACVPAEGACDDHADCAAEELCNFYAPYDPLGQTCLPACDFDAPSCPDGCSYCAPCEDAVVRRVRRLRRRVHLLTPTELPGRRALPYARPVSRAMSAPRCAPPRTARARPGVAPVSAGADGPWLRAARGVPPLPALDDAEGPRVPTEAPPVVDAHVHLFPDRLFEAIWRWFDVHGWPIRYKIHAREVIRFLLSRGVERIVALHYAHKPGVARALNTFVAELCREEPRVIGLATVMPGEDGAAAILDEAFAAGLRGVKLHAHVQCIGVDHPAMGVVYEACTRADKPLVIARGPRAEERALRLRHVRYLLRRPRRSRAA